MAQSPYTTITDYKTWAGIADASQDARIAAAIPRASALVQRFLGFDPAGGTFSEIYDGNSSRLMPVRNPPIISVSAINIADLGSTVIAPTSAISLNVGFYFDDKFVYLRGYTFCRGTQNVQIQYVSGYSQMPEEIPYATMLTVTAMVSAGDLDPNVASESVPGAFTSTFLADAGKLPAAAILVLTPLRRVTY